MAKQKQKKYNITNEGIGQIILLQIFSIILFLKGISATYHATMYAEAGQTWIIEKYAYIFKVAPTFLLIPLLVVAVNMMFNFNEKTKRALNILAVVLTIVGSFSVVWMF